MIGVRLFSGIIILIAIILIVVAVSTNLVQAEYFGMPKIDYQNLRNGDILMGWNDFSRFEGRTLPNAFFTANSVVSQKNFTHCCMIYIDPSIPRNRPEAYYAWNIACVPWSSPAIMKYKWSQPGSRLVPLSAFLSLYQFCCITPTSVDISNERMLDVINRYDQYHLKMAGTPQQYAYRVMKYFLEPNKPDTKYDHLFCTDITMEILEDLRICRATRPILRPEDLMITDGQHSKNIEFINGCGLLETRCIHVNIQSPMCKEIVKRMKEFGVDREAEDNLLFAD